ncbi:MAG: ABC transporter permease [Aliidongia sp.]
MLGFPLISGDPATALAQPESIVLTRRLAMKYFGTLNCLGQTLELNRTYPVRVTGIAEDPPARRACPFRPCSQATRPIAIWPISTRRRLRQRARCGRRRSYSCG